jgi:hypothetical protein
MSNKSDLIEHIKHVNFIVKCAIIKFNNSDHKITLPINYHTIDRYYNFILELDDINDGIDYGIIWFDNGSWSKYSFSDYGEGWINYSIPSIPTELL